MSAPPMPPPAQHGGYRTPALDECGIMVGHGIVIGLVLLSVYVSRIPSDTVAKFGSLPYQLLGLFAVVSITGVYGWIHGILAALAFMLIVSRALRVKREGLEDYIPAMIVTEGDGTEIIPDEHRWFVEKVLGENPFLVREKEVRTSAVQDFSERNMGNDSSPSSK